jgi:hypothetical protein
MEAPRTPTAITPTFQRSATFESMIDTLEYMHESLAIIVIGASGDLAKKKVRKVKRQSGSNPLRFRARVCPCEDLPGAFRPVYPRLPSGARDHLWVCAVRQGGGGDQRSAPPVPEGHLRAGRHLPRQVQIQVSDST